MRHISNKVKEGRNIDKRAEESTTLIYYLQVKGDFDVNSSMDDKPNLQKIKLDNKPTNFHYSSVIQPIDGIN